MVISKGIQSWGINRSSNHSQKDVVHVGIGQVAWPSGVTGRRVKTRGGEEGSWSYVCKVCAILGVC